MVKSNLRWVELEVPQNGKDNLEVGRTNGGTIDEDKFELDRTAEGTNGKETLKADGSVAGINGKVKLEADEIGDANGKDKLEVGEQTEDTIGETNSRWAPMMMTMGKAL